MPANPYQPLFEPLAIGPVTAKNRFYQVPHCCGMGHLHPQAHAAMRGIKAEGGWAVVSTEETEIHPSSDLSPYREQRIWDERDIPALRLMTDAVHEHGALAAVELVHNGRHAANLYSHIPTLAPNNMAIDMTQPRQARGMTKADIREFRRWHRGAALRAKQAGFDIIYVYAGHRMTLTQQFMLPETNTRTDEYGGHLENRIRLTRELLEETKDAVGDTCAVAFRFAVDELRGKDGMQAHEEGRAVVEMLAEIPDLWDVNVSDWANDSQTSRFAPDEAYQLPYTQFVKTVTNKPVVAVGRITSPDTMLSMVKRGVVDLIGAARPSIADPFLPKKIEQGRVDEIRECIGCNICVASDNMCVPIRCTQNPAMGEEWRRGWHPEKIRPKKSDAHVLVVGAGPAGLECGLQLAKRGYQVTISEASSVLGGRVIAESGLKGLSAWKRVHDYRAFALQKMPNVDIYVDSPVDIELVKELAPDAVFIATGSQWRRDGVGRSNRKPVDGLAKLKVLTPDDIMSGQAIPDNEVVIYDDDQAYIAGVIADQLSTEGHKVTLVTPASVVSPWTDNTLEQHRIQKLLLEQGVTIVANHVISKADSAGLDVDCVFTGTTTAIPCQTVILVTERIPEDGLYQQLIAASQPTGDAEAPEHIKCTVELMGDALVPGLIVDAVFSGRLAAENYQQAPEIIEKALFQREIISINN